PATPPTDFYTLSLHDALPIYFLGCVLLSGAAMSLPGRLRDPLARALRQTVLAPFLSLQQQIERLSASLARYDAVVAQRDSAALRSGERRVGEESGAVMRRCAV